MPVVSFTCGTKQRGESVFARGEIESERRKKNDNKRLQAKIEYKCLWLAFFWSSLTIGS